MQDLFPFNKDFSTSGQSLCRSFPQLLPSCMTLDDAGCCVLLLPLTAACRRTESLKGFTSLSCVNNGEVTVCIIRRSNGGHVVEVCVESMLAGNLDQRIGLITCEWELFSHSAKPDSGAGLVAADLRFGLQSNRKSKMTIRQAQEIATRHELEE